MTFRLNKSTPGRPAGIYKAPENICPGGRSATKLEVGYFKGPFRVYCFVDRETDRQTDRDSHTEKYIYILLTNKGTREKSGYLSL